MSTLRVLFLLLGLGLALFSAPALASCGTGKPAKHHAVLYWLGNSRDWETEFLDSLRTTLNLLVPESDKVFLALGGKLTYPLDQEDASFSPVKLPAISARVQKKTRRIPATLGGILAVAKELRRDFEALRKKDPAFRPEDFQLTVLISNHGSESVGKDGPRYGILADPHLSARVRSSDKGEPALDTEDLGAFARALPAGIRVKAFSGTCFSFDTVSAFLKEVRSDDTCKCGIAASAPGHPSFIIDDKLLLEDQIVRILARDRSSLWEAARGLPTGHPDEVFEWRYFHGGENLEATFSDQQVFEYFLTNRERLGLPEGTRATDIQEKAAEILQKAAALSGQGRLSAADSVTLELDSRTIDSLLLENYPWAGPALLKELRAVYERGGREQLRKVLDRAAPPACQGVRSPWELILGPRERLARDEGISTAFARKQLEKAFLLLADEDRKKRFAETKKCELDPVLPAPVQYREPASATGSTLDPECRHCMNALIEEVRKAFGG